MTSATEGSLEAAPHSGYRSSGSDVCRFATVKSQSGAGVWGKEAFQRSPWLLEGDVYGGKEATTRLGNLTRTN